MKLRVADRSALHARLVRLRAHLLEPRVHELNTLYDTPDRALFCSGRMLRVRVTTPAPAGAIAKRSPSRRPGARSAVAVWLTFKGAPPRHSDHRYKVREEREARVSDAAELAAILKGLRLKPSFRYENTAPPIAFLAFPQPRSSSTKLPSAISSRSKPLARAIDRAAAALGFGPGEYITRTYAGLFAESQRAKPSSPRRTRGPSKPLIARGDMLFPERPSPPAASRFCATNRPKSSIFAHSFLDKLCSTL